MSKTHQTLALFGFMVFAAMLRAQITFTVTAKVETAGDPLGYTTGNSYVFALTTGASFANNGYSSFSVAGQDTTWKADLAAHGDIWTSISSPTGLLGTYTTPAGDAVNSTLRYAYVGFLSNTFLIAQANANSGNLGITSPNSTPIEMVSLQLLQTGSFPALSYLSSYQDPITYFQSYTGTYNGAGSPNYWVHGNTLSHFRIFADDQQPASVSFSVTSLTISAVPEPTTHAVLAGFAVLGLAAWRRRR